MTCTWFHFTVRSTGFNIFWKCCSCSRVAARRSLNTNVFVLWPEITSASTFRQKTVSFNEKVHLILFISSVMWVLFCLPVITIIYCASHKYIATESQVKSCRAWDRLSAYISVRCMTFKGIFINKGHKNGNDMIWEMELDLSGSTDRQVDPIQVEVKRN